MTILRLLNVQGIAGLAVGAILGLLLIVQKGETRHWKKQAGQYEQLYKQGQAAFAGTVAGDDGRGAAPMPRPIRCPRPTCSSRRPGPTSWIPPLGRPIDRNRAGDPA